jgi:hypothetical protein
VVWVGVSRDWVFSRAAFPKQKGKMPAYKPSDDELDGYGSEPAVTPPGKSASAAEDTQSVDEQNAGASEILIAKDKLPSGTVEGDTCTFKVTKDFGDEVSLEYVKDSEEESDEQTSDNMASAAESELSAMDEEGI